MIFIFSEAFNFFLAYGQVLRMLGNGRVEAFCFNDGQKRICHIRGKMRKKVWVNQVMMIANSRQHSLFTKFVFTTETMKKFFNSLNRKMWFEVLLI
jgi:initiation factor 1A